MNVRFTGNNEGRKQSGRWAAWPQGLLIGWLSLLVLSSYGQSIRYVKPGGSGDGSSWTQASGDLQAMIYATGVEQVWVAAGRYQPINPVFPSFSLYVGVAVYGGFVGNETKLSERPNVNPIGGQPSSTTLINNGNRVIANRGLTNTASLDGVVITGNAGGIMNFNSSPRLTNCLITNNTLLSGGGAGMFNVGSNPILVNCVISNNKTGQQGSGGGMYNGTSSNPQLTNCIISGNHAENNGGGIANEGGSLVLTDCAIGSNDASYSIGPGRGPGNGGAGIYCASGSNITLKNCRIGGNYALDAGGGIYSSYSTLNLTNCVISQNGAGRSDGGAVILTGGTANLVNCLIARNYIYGYGTNGGIINSNNTLNMTNCTLVGTRSSIPYPYYQGKALTTDGRTQLTNCILWDNGSSENTGLGSGLYGPATVSYSLLQAGNSGYTGTSTNNIITTVSPFDATGNYTLSACSAAIDAGDPSTTTATVGTTDVYGQPRFYQGGRIDIGASEFQGTASQPVAITSQPPSGSAACAGSVVSAAVATTGTVGSYQWYKDGVSVSGQSSATLSLSNVQTGDAGSYSVVVIGTCNSLTSTAFSLTVNPVPSAPTLVTQSGQSYPAGVSSLTVSQNAGPVSLTVSGCAGGTLSWNGGNSTTLIIPTDQLGTQTYTATCTLNGCTSPAASFQLTVVPAVPTTQLSVLHRDADYGNTQDNIIRPYLQLANSGQQAIPYSELTVRYWFTSEGNAPPTDVAVYYAPLGAVQMKYVALSQPRQGAYGYVEYSFPGGGSLPAGGNSGPIENGIQKTNRSNFNELDDYSYQANYANFTPNTHITAYRNGTLVWGQEPTGVTSQTAVRAYSAAKDGPTTSQIRTRLELRNEGNVPLAASDLKVRYWFTADNDQPTNVFVDYADIGASNVQARVVRLPTPVAGADSYTELTFSPGIPVLASQSSLGAVEFRLMRLDYGLLSQTNDYSYAPNYGLVGLNPRITVYLNGSLVYGTEPTGVSARMAALEPVANWSARLLGNPVVGSHAQVELTGAAGQAVMLQLIDVQGRAVHEQRVEPAGVVEQVSVPMGSSQGNVLLRVSTANQHQQLKLLRP